jgi:hypothetical protein
MRNEGSHTSTGELNAIPKNRVPSKRSKNYSCNYPNVPIISIDKKRYNKKYFKKTNPIL